MSKRIIIRHPDGREYGIAPEAFEDSSISPRGSYAQRGFSIVGYVGGAPYEEPAAPPTSAVSARPGRPSRPSAARAGGE